MYIKPSLDKETLPFYSPLLYEFALRQYIFVNLTMDLYSNLQ